MLKTTTGIGVNMVIKKISAACFSAPIHDTVFLHPVAVCPVCEHPAIFPGEMRELTGSSVVRSMHRIS
jgi:hypothetical protein